MQLIQLSYHFGDASVPPPDHRSYTIEVGAATVQLTVDSYGDVLVQKKYDLPTNALSLLMQALVDCKIDYMDEKEEEGCTGGTTDVLSYTLSDGTQFRASNYYCGGVTYGNLGGDIVALKSLVKQYVPDLRKVIQSC